ncbi:MAG: asparaginyl-tRNA synthetase [Thermococcaceae archaeon]|nr:asparaginyl-tRNA synthetase [Thermococcaceae archaeon]
MSEPFWITDISREFYDREDPERPGHFRNYDLILPEGYGEVSSGGALCRSRHRRGEAC